MPMLRLLCLLALAATFAMGCQNRGVIRTADGTIISDGKEASAETGKTSGTVDNSGTGKTESSSGKTESGTGKTDPGTGSTGKASVVDPETGEICLLPPEPVEDDLSGKLTVGKPAPDFALTDARSGNTVKLADYKGKTVMLFFWASWCPTCKMACRSGGSLNNFWKVMEETPDSQVAIVGIGSGTDDNAGSQKAFLDTHSAPWASAFDDGNSVERKYGVRGVPTVVVVGKDGTVLTYGRYERKYRDDLLEYLKQECTMKPEGK